MSLRRSRFFSTAQTRCGRMKAWLPGIAKLSFGELWCSRRPIPTCFEAAGAHTVTRQSSSEKPGFRGTLFPRGSRYFIEAYASEIQPILNLLRCSGSCYLIAPPPHPCFLLACKGDWGESRHYLVLPAILYIHVGFYVAPGCQAKDLGASKGKRPTWRSELRDSRANIPIWEC